MRLTYAPNINKTRYVIFLRRYLFPVIHEMICLDIQLDKIIFHQDNAPSYELFSVMD